LLQKLVVFGLRLDYFRPLDLTHVVFFASQVVLQTIVSMHGHHLGRLL